MAEARTAGAPSLLKQTTQKTKEVASVKAKDNGERERDSPLASKKE